MWTVYRMYDADGALLYAGCTSDFKRRMSQHRSDHRAARKPWIAEVVRVVKTPAFAARKRRDWKENPIYRDKARDRKRQQYASDHEHREATKARMRELYALKQFG